MICVINRGPVSGFEREKICNWRTPNLQCLTRGGRGMRQIARVALDTCMLRTLPRKQRYPSGCRKSHDGRAADAVCCEPRTEAAPELRATRISIWCTCAILAMGIRQHQRAPIGPSLYHIGHRHRMGFLAARKVRLQDPARQAGAAGICDRPSPPRAAGVSVHPKHYSSRSPAG